jgi:hypothetical protein
MRGAIPCGGAKGGSAKERSALPASARQANGCGSRYFSSSIVTATAPMAESRTLLPSTSATSVFSMK